MNKSDLIDKINLATDLPKKQIADVINAAIASINTALMEDDDVTLLGFGTFRTRVRAPRQARNPSTGEIMVIPPARVPVFRPGKQLRESLGDEC